MKLLASKIGIEIDGLEDLVFANGQVYDLVADCKPGTVFKETAHALPQWTGA